MPIAQLMWPYIERNLERLVGVFDAASEVQRVWRPPAPETNSLAALVSHTLSNAEDNLLGTVLGVDVRYDRQADFDRPEQYIKVVRLRWASLRGRLETALPLLTDEFLLAPVEHPRRGRVTRFEAMLVVARHAAEHLAHAELTRDLFTSAQPASPAQTPPPAST